MHEPTDQGERKGREGSGLLGFSVRINLIAVVTVLVSIWGVSVAIKGNQEAAQKTKRHFAMKFEFKLDRACLQGATFGIEIVNEGERPLTVTSIKLLGNDLHSIVELPEVRIFARHSKLVLAEAPSPLPRTLQDGQVVEVKYPMTLLLAARHNLWPDIAEAEDANEEGELLDIHRQLKEFAEVLQEDGANHELQTCLA